MKLEYKKIKVPIYKRVIKLAILEDLNKINDLHYIDERDFSNNDAVVVSEEKPHIYLASDLLEQSKIYIISVLSHEAIHLTHNILHSVGVVASFENDEAVAYLQEFIMVELLKKLKNHIKLN